jgi:hypothetical protein
MQNSVAWNLLFAVGQLKHDMQTDASELTS